MVTAGVRYTDDLKYDRGGRNIMDCNNQFIQPTLGGSDLSVFNDFLNNRTGEEGADGLDDITGKERVRGGCIATKRNDVEADGDKITYLGRVSYELNDSLLYLSSVGSGYRAGEIQDGGDVTNPENSVSYEVGYKFISDYVRFNAAGFFIDYTDLIRAGFDEEENQIVTSNVAGAEIKGLEAEVVWLLGDSGTFEFGGGYLDAKYTDYLVDGPGFGTNIPAILNENGEPTGFYSLAGNTMPQSPEFSFNSTLRWEFETENGFITPRLNVRYVDTVFFRDHNENSAEINNLVDGEVQTGLFVGNPAGQDAHTKVNVGILYASSSDNDFNVDFYINNLTNEMTKSSSSVDNNTALFPSIFIASHLGYAHQREFLMINMNKKYYIKGLPMKIFALLKTLKAFGLASKVCLLLLTYFALSACGGDMTSGPNTSGPAKPAFAEPAPREETFSKLRAEGTIWMNEQDEKVSLRGVNLWQLADDGNVDVR